MNSKRRYFQVACLASISALLGACSSSGDVKTTPTPTVVMQSSAPAPEPQKDNLNALFVTPPPVASSTVVKAPPKAVVKNTYTRPKPKVYTPPKPVVVATRPSTMQWPKPAVVPQKRVVRQAPVYVAPKPAQVKQVTYRPQVQRQAQVRPQARPVVTSKRYSQGRLTGDFAGNRQAQAFVQMMASRHGFAPSYVNGVLSRTKATSWLKRQAYSDANPKPKSKNRRPANWTNYQKRFITSRHINAGTAFYKKYQGSLQRAASQYGVPEEYILGIMGVETIYGGNVGKDRAIDALATMSFMNSRRGSYFASELEAYLLMTRRTGLDPLTPKASWAGALGLPQFMPSNIKKYGVDYDGDGAVNLWTPHDAIGSIANYLSKHGWRRGEIAAIPARRTGGSGYSSLNSGFKYKHSLSTLARKGLKPAYPGVSGQVHMVKLRTNAGNEYWIGGNNFYAITRYNHSSFYAMAVHQLAQAIKKRVKPSSSYSAPRVIEASRDKFLLEHAANALL